MYVLNHQNKRVCSFRCVIPLSALAIFIVLLILGTQSVHAQQTAVGSGSPLRVVATFSVLADMVKQLGGDFVEVSTLVDWDEDAHIFQPSPGDVKKVAAADLLVLNGLGFEGWLERLLNAAGFSGVSVEATLGVDLIKMDLRGTQGFAPYRRQAASVYDPHAWQSLKAARQYVMNISAALIQIDPLHADNYRALRDAYLKAIVRLDESLTTALAQIPEHKRRLVVPHNAFAYLARDYHLTIHSLQGMSTDSEASAADMIQLVRLIKALNITAIFTETISDQRLIRVIEAETEARIEGALISGALSRSLAPHYLDMIEYNTNLIIRALSR